MSKCKPQLDSKKIKEFKLKRKIVKSKKCAEKASNITK